MKKIVVKNSEEGKKLIKYLSDYFVSATDGFIYKMLRKKNILLNDKKASGKELIKSGDSISIFFKDETIDKFTKETDDKYEGLLSIDASGLDIIYEDNDMMIIDKDENMLSQKSKEGDISINELALKHMIDNNELNKEDYKVFKPSIVNRIDRNTKGLIIFAKNYKTSVDLSYKIKNRLIEKYYIARVNGIIKKEKEKIEGYLKKDNDINKVNVISIDEYDKLCVKNKESIKNYEKIETEYEVIKKEKDTTILLIKLITGKTHQIRAHLSYIGHPIVGDKKYMDIDKYNDNVKKFNVKSQELISYRLIIDGITYKSRYKI